MKKFLVGTALVGAAVAAAVVWWKRSAPTPDLWDELDERPVPATWPSGGASETSGAAVVPSAPSSAPLVEDVKAEKSVSKSSPKKKKKAEPADEPKAEAS